MTELQARMTSAEFGEWLAFDSIEPVGARRDDVLAALVASVTANTARDDKQHPEPFSLDEFLPEWGVTEEDRAVRQREELEDKLLAAFRAAGMDIP